MTADSIDFWMTGRQLLLPGLIGFAVCLMLTAPLQKLAWRCDWVARPNVLVPTHKKPVPYLGGTAVLSGVLAGLSTSRDPMGALPLICSLLLIHGLGVWDDLKPLRPIWKLAGQCAIAAFALYSTINRRVSFSGYVELFLCLLVATNAVNLIDVMDGLSCGVSLLSFLGLAIIASLSGAISVASVALCFCGSLAAFLRQNRYPARMYLGDGGSLMIGFAYALLFISDERLLANSSGRVAGLFAFCVPLFELCILIVLRTLARNPFWIGSRDHFALRLLAAGWRVPQVILCAYAVSLAGVASSVFIFKFWGHWSINILISASVVAASILFLALARIKIAVVNRGARAISNEGKRI